MAQYSGTYATPRLDLGEAMREYMFTTDKFIGTRVLAPFATPVKKGNFSKITRAGLLRQATGVKRAPKSAYNRDDWGAKDQSFECVERGHEIPVDHSEREFYASDFDAERLSVELAMFRVLLDQEIDIKDLILNTTTYTVGNGKRTDVGTAWSTKTAPIIADILAAKEKVRTRVGEEPNTMVIGASEFRHFLTNDQIREAIQPTKLPGIDAIVAALEALFGIEEILVGKGVYNSAKEGQPETITDIWASGFAWIGKTVGEGASLMVPCIGRTLVWVSEVPEAVMVEEYEEPQTRSTVFRARNHCDELEIDSSYAQLLDIAG